MTFRLCTLSLNSVSGVRIQLSPQHSCCVSPKTPKYHILIFEPSLMTTNLKMWPPGRLWLKRDKEVESKTEPTWLHEVTTRTNDRWKGLNQRRVNIAVITSSKKLKWHQEACNDVSCICFTGPLVSFLCYSTGIQNSWGEGSNPAAL